MSSGSKWNVLAPNLALGSPPTGPLQPYYLVETTCPRLKWIARPLRIMKGISSYFANCLISKSVSALISAKTLTFSLRKSVR